ncbi:MAG: high-affinity branched-chain amino acid ABC transporter permease LivM [Methyloligellaceae bacterium]
MTTQVNKSNNTVDFVASLKDATAAAIIVFLLCIGIVSHIVEQTSTGPSLKDRWDLVLIFVVLAFILRLLHNFRKVLPERSRTNTAIKKDEVTTSYLDIIKTAAIPFLIIFAFVFPILPFADRQLLNLAIEILTYIMLGWGLNIVVGLAGMLDLGYVAFYAVGAYSFALLAQNFDLGFWACLPLAGILAAFWGIILGFPVLRLRGDYLAIVTLAFGEIIRIILINWHEVTGGPDGLSRIPSPTLFGLEFKRFGDNTFADYFGIAYDPTHKFIVLFYIILILALITNYVVLRLKRLPIGRAWEALREDEIACRSLGINTTTTKLTAFSIGAMFGGFAGAFFATKQGSITPNSFVFIESAIILAVVVLGGMRSQIGVVISAFVLVGSSEALRNMDFLKNIFGEDFNPAVYRMLIFGIAMVAIMVLWPKGLIASRQPSIVLKKAKTISGDLVQGGKG